MRAPLCHLAPSRGYSAKGSSISGRKRRTFSICSKRSGNSVWGITFTSPLLPCGPTISPIKTHLVCLIDLHMHLHTRFNRGRLNHGADRLSDAPTFSNQAPHVIRCHVEGIHRFVSLIFRFYSHLVRVLCQRFSDKLNQCLHNKTP